MGPTSALIRPLYAAICTFVGGFNRQRVDSESGTDTRNRETMVDHRRVCFPYKEHNVAGHRLCVFVDSIREMRGTFEILNVTVIMNQILKIPQCGVIRNIVSAVIIFREKFQYFIFNGILLLRL